MYHNTHAAWLWTVHVHILFTTANYPWKLHSMLPRLCTTPKRVLGVVTREQSCMAKQISGGNLEYMDDLSSSAVSVTTEDPAYLSVQRNGSRNSQRTRVFDFHSGRKCPTCAGTGKIPKGIAVRHINTTSTQPSFSLCKHTLLLK